MKMMGANHFVWDGRQAKEDTRIATNSQEVHGLHDNEKKCSVGKRTLA